MSLLQTLWYKTWPINVQRNFSMCEVILYILISNNFFKKYISIFYNNIHTTVQKLM